MVGAENHPIFSDNAQTIVKECASKLIPSTGGVNGVVLPVVIIVQE